MPARVASSWAVSLRSMRARRISCPSSFMASRLWRE